MTVKFAYKSAINIDRDHNVDMRRFSVLTGIAFSSMHIIHQWI